MKKFLVIIAALLLFVGCAQTSLEDIALNEDDTSNLNITQSEAAAIEFPDITFIDGMSDNPTQISDNEASISKSGTYEFSGDYSSITVNVNKDVDNGTVFLILNGVNIDNQSSTPINIIEGENVVIVLQDGTTNTVSQGAIQTEDTEFPSAAIYSKADTAIMGSGTLNVSTLYNDGINSRDDLIILGGNINIDAVSDGIVGKDLLAIRDANITVTAQKDGLKSSNAEEAGKGNFIIESGTYNITAQNDGLSAEQTLQINGGSFTIKTGGGFSEVLNDITQGEGSGDTIQPSSMLSESMKGIKGTSIIINAGEYNISSYEDGVHGANSLVINGGTFNIISGDDAIHCDTNVTINDIDLTIENAYEGVEGASVDINGGTMNINVLDDGINAGSDTGYITITNGEISITAQGDGIDSNGDLNIGGGTIIIEVNAIYAGGDSELDVGGVYTISGGTVTDENGNEVQPNDDQMGNPRNANRMAPHNQQGMMMP